MFQLEKQLYEKLLFLKDNYNLNEVKAEFEAEGSSFNDLVRMRRITLKAGVELHLKIGGVEAIKDIKEALEIGVDGLIAPMVESAFGATKFISAVNKIYRDNKPILTLNVETKNAYDEIDYIIDVSRGSIDNITLGRSDFSRSYFSKDVYPDSEFVTGAIIDIGEKVQKNGMIFTVGGSVTQNTINIFNENDRINNLVNKIETRKVIFPTNSVLTNSEALKEALSFEKLYILSKKEIIDNSMEDEVSRLIELEKRI